MSASQEKADLIRFALMLSDSNASTFDSTLEKVISFSLFKAKVPLTAEELCEKIKEISGLSFSPNEIRKAIKSDKRKCVVSSQTGEGDDYKYSIAGGGLESVSDHIKSVKTFDDVIKRFVIELQPSIVISEEEAKKVILGFFYIVFNTNKDCIASLLGSEYSTLKSSFNDMDASKKKIVFSFLEWKDSEKDKIVFGISKAAFSFCCLTMKRPLNIEPIAKSKRIFLDSNVIISMVGFDGEPRKRAMDLFLKKCAESGIKVFYTNITEEECLNTVRGFTFGFQKTIAGEDSISASTAEEVYKNSPDLFLYQKYISWSAEAIDKTDFDAFRSSIAELVNETLRKFLKASVPYDLIHSKSKEIGEYCSGLSEYKYKLLTDLHMDKEITDSSIKSDIQNYFFVMKSYKDGCRDFSEISDFFVTSDSKFVRWVKEEALRSCPSPFVLVDVMYSVVLHFSPRADDDFRAFNEFMSIVLQKESALGSEVKEKEELVSIIMKIPEKMEIRELVILQASKIYENFRSSSPNGVFDAEKIAKQALGSVASSKYEEGVNKGIEEERQKNDSEKTEIEKASRENGVSVGREEALRFETNKKAKRNKTIITFFYIALFAVASFFMIYFCFYCFLQVDVFHIGGIIAICFSLIGLFVPFLLWVYTQIAKRMKWSFLSENEVFLYEREIKNFEKNLKKGNEIQKK